MKRLMDVLLTLLLFPLLVVICSVGALLIRLGSRGSVFFVQERVGQKGAVFKMFKLRTMIDGAERALESDNNEWQTRRKIQNDNRIAPFGKLVRKTSIDEIPQFINVLRGEMSLVGPRPVPEGELSEMYGSDRVYYEDVKPGITGLWQVSGRNSLSYRERVELDKWYAQNRSIWLDIYILLKTPLAVLKVWHTS